MTQAEHFAQLTEQINDIKTSLTEVKVGLQAVKEGQDRAELLFTNHLEHHMEDKIRSEDRFRKWLWVSIPTIATLIIALVGSAYYLARN